MNISDQQLYEQCREYGEKAKMWRSKFLGLLPEVNRRKLYEKKGFGSIFEFAAKLAGTTEEQVRMVLNLEKRLSDKPTLHSLLVEGKVSANKLVRITSIATSDNEAVLAEQVQLLPQKALETLVRDTKSEPESLRAHANPQSSSDLSNLNLNDEVKGKLLELKAKGIDLNELLLELLQKRELEIAQEKEALSAQTQQQSSRYIPAQIKKLIKKEHGTKCSIETCSKNSRIIHHTRRHALKQNHNPHFLAPLCEEHHKIAHAIDVKVQEVRALRKQTLT
jgi:hypothetical protein